MHVVTAKILIDSPHRDSILPIMSMIAPANRTRGPNKGGGRRNENNRIYAHPLPLIFSADPPSHFRSLLGLVGLSLTEVLNPHCEGFFDPSTRSVWVSNPKDSTILWRRGFFGKGDLSRSEPSWLARQINIRNIRRSGGKRTSYYPSVLRNFVSLFFVELTSEEVTAKRRAERKQFKLDRARAIAAVAAEAETIFATEGRVIQPALSGPGIPSAATWKPAPAIVEEPPTTPVEQEQLEDEEPLEDVEHLQLTLPEAFFLLWNLDCLTVLDPHTVATCFLVESKNTNDIRTFLTPSCYSARTDESAANMGCLPNCLPSAPDSFYSESTTAI